MPRTRSSAPDLTEKSENVQRKTLTPAERPSRTFIIPAATSNNARLLSLPNPQSDESTRYFFCPNRGLFEFTVVTEPLNAPRSILFTPNKPSSANTSENENTPTAAAAVAKKADVLVATPIDAMFFVIPLLASLKSGHSLFQPLDDIIDSNDDLSPHLRHVLYDDTFRNTLLARTEAICDTVEAGDEKMFRFSEKKLLKELLGKAERMAEHGLPPSLEERFVRQALAAPLMSVKRDDVSTSQVSNEGIESLKTEERQDSPSTATTTGTSSVSTPAGEYTPPPQVGEELSTSSHVHRLLRIQTALIFMRDSYLPRSLSSRVEELLASDESPIDFSPLTSRLKELADLRAQAHASRTMSDFSRKRGLDDEEVEARAEKKRRKEEEDKKSKAAESRALRDLKKVNTTGMKKMSDFFSKAAAKKTT